MTAEGVSSRAARRWQALRDLPDRTSLRTKLITGLLALVIVAVAAISVSSMLVLRSYLTSQDDSQLKSVYSLINSQGLNPLTPGMAYRLHGTSWSRSRSLECRSARLGSRAACPAMAAIVR